MTNSYLFIYVFISLYIYAFMYLVNTFIYALYFIFHRPYVPIDAFT